MIEMKKAFERENKKAVIAFLAAGDPTLEDTKRYLSVLEESGVDMIELGIPFSDPIAESAFIQEADLRALENGVHIDGIFSMLESTERNVPIVFMTYANPVFFYGYDQFFRRCKEVGVAGVVIPDIPFEENAEVKEVARLYGVTVVDMVAPVSTARVQKISKYAQGFIYLLSDMGLKSIGLKNAVNAAREVTATPVCKEFDSTLEEAVKVAKEADGVIIGSALVKIIAEHGANADQALKEYVSSVASAVHSVR